MNGRLLVFGGAYSNHQALEHLQLIAKQEGISPSNVINTGDAVGYCAQPEQCLTTIKEWGIHSICGNVEHQLRDNLDDCGCNFNQDSRCDMLSRTWYPYAQANVSEESKAWLKAWPDFITFTYAGHRVFVLHGSYFNTSEFIFKSTDWTVKKNNFESTNADVIIAGHCGLPFNDCREGLYWLNPGVIGMPANDGSTRVWYMVLDDSAGLAYHHKSMDYEHQQTALLMARHGLPSSYAQTLSSGIWDNCEILPEIEASQQGQRIQFQED